MSITVLPHAEIGSYLMLDVCKNLFPLFVCQERLDKNSLAFVEGGTVRGAVVVGADFGVFTAWNPWLVADDAAVATALLSRLHARSRTAGLQLAWQYGPVAIQVCPGLPLTRDLYLRRAAGEISATPRHTAVRVNNEVLTQVEVPAELRRAIGDLSDFPTGAPFWGLIVDGRLTSIAETLVRVGDCVSIQQVYTVEDARQQGHAKELIGWILGRPELAGATVTWLASAANVASVELARSLGFADFCEFGFLEATSE